MGVLRILILCPGLQALPRSATHASILSLETKLAAQSVWFKISNLVVFRGCPWHVSVLAPLPQHACMYTIIRCNLRERVGDTPLWSNLIHIKFSQWRRRWELTLTVAGILDQVHSVWVSVYLHVLLIWNGFISRRHPAHPASVCGDSSYYGYTSLGVKLLECNCCVSFPICSLF